MHQLIFFLFISIGAVSAASTPLMKPIISVLDESDRSSLARQNPRTLKKIDHGEQLSTDDIKTMTRAGLSDETIIQQIDATKSIFYLSSADIVDLKKSGVSQRVINHMIQTGNQ